MRQRSHVFDSLLSMSSQASSAKADASQTPHPPYVAAEPSAGASSAAAVAHDDATADFMLSIAPAE